MLPTTQRPKCSVPDCPKFARTKGLSPTGKRRYDTLCTKHHRCCTDGSYEQLDNRVCALCGWDKAYCDRHRLDKSAGYYPENVVILCPNCHRLVSIGVIIIDRSSMRPAPLTHEPKFQRRDLARS